MTPEGGGEEGGAAAQKGLEPERKAPAFYTHWRSMLLVVLLVIVMILPLLSTQTPKGSNNRFPNVVKEPFFGGFHFLDPLGGSGY